MSSNSDAALAGLAERINTHHAASFSSQRTSIEQAIECGNVLTEAKELVAHGQWLPWLSANTKVAQRTAQQWMRFARNPDEILAKCALSADLTFAELDRQLAVKRLPAHGETMVAIYAIKIIEEYNVRVETDKNRKLDVVRYPEVIWRYARNIDDLPPIEVNQNLELIDGFFRMQAHLYAGREMIAATVYETKDKWDVLRRNCSLNSAGGIPLLPEDRGYALAYGIDSDELAELKESLKDCVRDEYGNYVNKTRRVLSECLSPPLYHQLLDGVTDEMLVHACKTLRTEETA